MIELLTHYLSQLIFHQEIQYFKIGIVVNNAN